MMVKLEPFTLLSHEKYQPVPSSVQIPGKLPRVSLHEDTFIVSSIMVKKKYSDGKGNHINSLEGFWWYLKRKLSSKGGIRQEKPPLYAG